MRQLRQAALPFLQALAILVAGAFVFTDALAQQGARPDKVFAGDNRCTRCHDEEDDYPVLEIAKGKHGAASKITGMTCTTCHGESDRHVNKPADSAERPKPDRVFGRKGERVTPAAVREQPCLSCHGGDRHLAFWDSGRHKTNDIACDSCHLIHPSKTPPLRKDNPSITPFVTTERQLQYETCTACHKQVRSQLLKPSHHPIIEGKLACTDCHNPHGALSQAMVKAESIPQLCTSCHAEKRGPFVWEHPPAMENCLTCHNSHGANHARLLTEKPPNVCQDCHDASQHPGTIYDGSGSWTGSKNTRLIARGCTNCHNQIHGSNAPAMRGKFFFR